MDYIIICTESIDVQCNFCFLFTHATHISAVDDYDIDAKRYHLIGEFTMLLPRLGTLLQQCTNVDSIKNFLRLFSHPLYPEKLYVEPCVYCKAKTATEIFSSLTPTYINYINHHLLREIVKKFGNKECKHHYQMYEETFKKLVRKLWHYSAPVTDNDIEQCSSQTRLKVSVDGDFNDTTPQDVQTVQGSITQATGIGQEGLVYTNQDPGNSIIFNFLIPHSCVVLFCELCHHDLSILAAAGISKIQVDILEIANIKQHFTELKMVNASLSFRPQSSREQIKPSSIEYYLKERQDISRQECSDLVSMMKMIPDSQLKEICSKELLLEFSACIQDWKMLAPFLGLHDFYYDEFTTKYPQVTDQNYQLLLFWKRREMTNAIYHHLLETVVVHGKAKEIEALIQIPLRG